MTDPNDDRSQSERNRGRVKELVAKTDHFGQAW